VAESKTVKLERRNGELPVCFSPRNDHSYYFSPTEARTIAKLLTDVAEEAERVPETLATRAERISQELLARERDFHSDWYAGTAMCRGQILHELEAVVREEREACALVAHAAGAQLRTCFNAADRIRARVTK
jgi:hypothetical protein